MMMIAKKRPILLKIFFLLYIDLVGFFSLPPLSIFFLKVKIVICSKEIKINNKSKTVEYFNRPNVSCKATNETTSKFQGSFVSCFLQFSLIKREKRKERDRDKSYFSYTQLQK